MNYPEFPQIATPSYSYEEGPEDPGIYSKYENGLTTGRARFTRSRLGFSLRWNAMGAADKAALLNFYRNVIKGSASAFKWTHNDLSSEFYIHTFIVRAIQPPTFQKVSRDRWAVTLVIQEV
jgi:hypothetical protein